MACKKKCTSTDVLKPLLQEQQRSSRVSVNESSNQGSNNVHQDNRQQRQQLQHRPQSQHENTQHMMENLEPCEDIKPLTSLFHTFPLLIPVDDVLFLSQQQQQQPSRGTRPTSSDRHQQRSDHLPPNPATTPDVALQSQYIAHRLVRRWQDCHWRPPIYYYYFF